MSLAIQTHLDSHPISTLGDLFSIAESRQEVYEAIANNNAFFDLERDYIMDHKAPVYRDRTVWEADRICRGRPVVEVGVGGVIDTTVGSKVIYDGQPATVVSTEFAAIWLKSEGGSLNKLSTDALIGLVQSNRLTAFSPGQQPGQAGLVKIAAAGTQKLMRALHRYSLIESWVTGKNMAGLPSRSLRRYYEQFRKAESLLGTGLAGLLDNQEGRGNRTSRIDPRVLDEVAAVIKNELMTDVAPSIATAHRLLCHRLRSLGLPLLSRKSFNTQAEAVDRQKWMLARFGHKAANTIRPPHPVSDIPVKGDRAWEFALIDSEQVDLEMISERTGAEIPLTWLTVMLNINPTYPLGWYLAPHKPNEESVLMTARDCVRRHNRLPDVVVYDLGSEHRGTTFDVLRAVYRSDFISRPGGNPRFGPEIESFWNSINKYLIHQLKGNRG